MVELQTKQWRRGCFLAIGHPYHAKFYNWLVRLAPDIIVYEEFIYLVKYIGDEGGHTQQIDLTAKEYIGLIKLYGQVHPTCEVVKRQPGQAFKFWDDDKLKAMGLYVKGSKNTNGAPHIRDATRHALDYVVNTRKRMDFMDALKPRG